MIKKILLITIVSTIFVFMLLFNNNNSDLISIDLEITKITTTSSIIFIVIFVTGWAFGILCSLFYIIRLLNQKRILRSELRDSINENSMLKNKPLQDAD